MELRSITYQSSKIFYRTTGKGEPVVLIHGFAEDGDIWQHQIDFLENNFQLIIPDLPGSGKSELISDMSIEGMAELINEIVNIELQKFPLQGAEGACLIGHSMGGYISLAFAEKYPERLTALGLVHSSAFADSEEKKAMRLKAIEFVKKNGAYEFLKATIVALFTEQWYEHNMKKVDVLIEKSEKFSDEAIIRYYQAMINRPDRTSVLKNFNKPILIIIGEHDNAVPFQQSLHQCYLPGQSHVHILRNSAHMGMWEETAHLNRFLLDFLQ